MTTNRRRTIGQLYNNTVMSTETESNPFDNEHSSTVDSIKKPILLDDSTHNGPRETTTLVSKTPSTDNIPIHKHLQETTFKPLIQNLDVLKYIISTMAGKDKLAKVTKCIIDLIRLRLLSSTTTVSSKQVMVLLRPLIYLTNFIRSIITLSSANWVSQQLSIFRYALRFGGTPFRIIDFMRKISHQYNKSGLDLNQWNQFLINEATIQDGVDIYYGIFDELDMLYKLKLISNKKLHPVVVKHEAISWEFDILLGLKKNYKLLQVNKQKQVELNVKLQTHNLLTSSTGDKNSSLTQEFALFEKADSIKSKLQELQNDSKLIKLDLGRLFMDLMANSTDLFHWDQYLPKGSYAALSLVSGSFNIYKYWCVSRKQLENK